MPRTKARQTKEIFIQNLRGGTPIHEISTFGDEKLKQYMWRFVRVTCIDQYKNQKYHYGRLLNISIPNRDNIRSITLYSKNNHEVMKWHFYSHCFADSIDGFKLEVNNCENIKKGIFDLILLKKNKLPEEIYKNIYSYLKPDYFQIL